MKRVLPKTLPFVLIVFAIFTVSLTENLQIADGFLTESTEGWKYEISPGESQVGTWTLINTNEYPINLEFRAEGQGSEFFVFEKLATLEPGTQRIFEFIVTIPNDHPDNIEYHPQLFALELGEKSEGGAAVIVFNYQMVANPKILIGDNPVFTPEPEPVVVEEELIEETVSDEELTFEAVEEKPIETLEEKLARIQEANKEVKVDDTFEEEAVPDYEPEPIYELEPKDIVQPNEETIVEETPGCGFIDWLLSLFGMAKC